MLCNCSIALLLLLYSVLLYIPFYFVLFSLLPLSYFPYFTCPVTYLLPTTYHLLLSANIIYHLIRYYHHLPPSTSQSIDRPSIKLPDPATQQPYHQSAQLYLSAHPSSISRPLLSSVNDIWQQTTPAPTTPDTNQHTSISARSQLHPLHWSISPMQSC